MTTSTSVFQITPFENCDECISKVRRAVRQIGGLKLIGMDPEKGILIISSKRHEPETIRAALEPNFQNKSIILLQNKHSSGVNVNRDEAGRSTVDFRDMTGMLMTLPEAGRVRRVECRQDVLRVDYYEKPSMISNVAAADVSDFVQVSVPPTSTKPSAPPISTPYNGYPVNGWPYADHYTTPQKDDYPDCACTIM
ncbi:unnamed protein product [Lactuca saligna]|uniref:HMA domain-containing protein n=1 Tax=Lactuca saligna TaxID=75948 RepID=A0AA35YGS8_LACSI|nr:unnamed protein product [Lactuca saligna]